MGKKWLTAGFVIALGMHAGAQGPLPAARLFIQTLDSSQRLMALLPFETDERYRFFYFPVNDRKGIPLDRMNASQRDAAMRLVASCLSESAAKKVSGIMQLENVLKQQEARRPDDHYRDPERYFFSVFGIPAGQNTWGWRLDGHHVCFSFYARSNQLISGTPGFLGANPAIVQQGTEQGREVLREERDEAFSLLHAFSQEQLKKVIFTSEAPGDIITRVDRSAMISHPAGIPYSEMNPAQQELFLKLISLYIHRYTKLLADDMFRKIQAAGLDKLQFAWAGSTEPGMGHPHYYRIQGPTLIIEYDNTQNNANHVHTVFRDLTADFGGDELLAHYQAEHPTPK